MTTKKSPLRIAALCVGGIISAVALVVQLTSGHPVILSTDLSLAVHGVLVAKKNNRDAVAWALLIFLFGIPAAIVLAIIDHKRRKALGLKWYQRERAHNVPDHERSSASATGGTRDSITGHNSPDARIRRPIPPDVSLDDVLFALHTLGGTRLVWDAYPVGDGPLEIGSLHLEDTTGKPIRFGWAARRCEDDAYELANRYSNASGHYVLALPGGTLTSAPSMRSRVEVP